MASILSYLSDHHKACDALLVEAEGLLAEKDWQGFSEAWLRFEHETLAHFNIEETILFPAFEAKTGMTNGPTMVMRSEHAQVKALFEQMQLAIHNQELERAIGIIESVMLLIQQHNMKEEQILYPMSDTHLENNEALVTKMDNQLSS